MKTFKKSLAVILTVLMMLSMMIVGGVSTNAADTVTLYCKCAQDWWKKDGAAVAVHYWGGSSETSWPGVKGTAVEGETDLWQFEVPADSTGLIFVRMGNSGDQDGKDWGAKTANLSIPTDGRNLYTITSTAPVWGNPGVTGEWSVYSTGIEDTTASSEATSESTEATVESTEATTASTEATQATVESTEATQPTTQPASEPADTVTLYCKCAQDWWKKDGAAVGVYYWSDSSQPIKWPGVRGKAVEGETDLWQFEVPADMPNIIFSRVNGSGDIADWGAQTATLSMPTDGTNLYTITSTDATWGSKPGVTGEWSVYGAEPVETDYTVVFNYVTEDGTQTLTKTTTSAESDVTKIATSVMPNIENKMYSYALGECTADGTTITANLVETKKLYSVTVDGTIMETQFGYKDKATVTLKDGTEYTFYVTGDVEITSDDPKVAAALSLDAVTVTDTKVSMDLLATANVEKFARMGVAFATAEKTVDEIAAAVANVTTGTAASNGVAVHNSTVDTPNESGSYQFTYAPYVSKDKADKTLYFYTFAVDTDGNVSVSSVVSVDLANAVA